jgi:30S ribosomal protein S31
MGRGDKKTAKGKRALGSYGNSRRKKTSTGIKPAVKAEVAEKPVKKAAPKKTAAAKEEGTKKPAAKKTTKKKTEE